MLKDTRKQNGKQADVKEPFLCPWDPMIAKLLSEDMCQLIAQNCVSPLPKSRTTPLLEYIDAKEEENQAYNDHIDKVRSSAERKKSSSEKSDEKTTTGSYTRKLGLIASLPYSEDDDTFAQSLRRRTARHHQNRTSYRAVDLYELFRFTGKTPNELLSLPPSQISFTLVEPEELTKVCKKLGNAKTSIVVQCSPMLGLSLVAKLHGGNGEFVLVDALGLFTNSGYPQIRSVSKGMANELAVPVTMGTDLTTRYREAAIVFDYFVKVACNSSFLPAYREEFGSIDRNKWAIHAALYDKLNDIRDNFSAERPLSYIFRSVEADEYIEACVKAAKSKTHEQMRDKETAKNRGSLDALMARAKK